MIKRSILLVAKEVLTDQGTHFMSSAFKKILHAEGIGHAVTTAYNPTGNSIVERMNQEIAKGLRLLRDYEISETFERIEKSINLLYHHAIKMSPIQAYTVINNRLSHSQKLAIKKEVNENIERSRSNSAKAGKGIEEDSIGRYV